jgi:23S rRNA (cytidine1920-2'-O)/16S rRNA (cytidine1409-2'-O)-methyltransferase
VRASLPYVSRGGFKLAAALDGFEVSPLGCICADIGASTGGFTDVLLQRGATRVYALDVGYGQLAWKLRQDPRVVVMDRTNVRYLERLPEPVQIVTVDVSFISLEHIFAPARRFLSASGDLIALIKPQFEAGKGQVGRGGIVRDANVHRTVVEKVIGLAERAGLVVLGLMRSPIHGTEGNLEFLIHLSPEKRRPVVNTGRAVDELFV